ncbi:nuclear transport factor 2 family protein [Massilia sp. CCM 9210]|uniref:nuclear transport factor 2 family protein n=1 Tax=Massilia scottii TaxID=3057166 RepID=UPI002796D6AC|nr:nuclear transport factor 2 family protein [Massilia sp. CCM 9210]MDQ1811902.1 nuclear transport factor 2 family protein [Massilia sp. CCM 9210]
MKSAIWVHFPCVTHTKVWNSYRWVSRSCSLALYLRSDQAGKNRFSGTHRGMANVGPMLGAMMEVSKGTFAITRAEHYMASGDWVAITVEFAGEANGIKLKQAGVDLIRIDDGKIVEVRLFSSDQQQEDAFWGQ